jgi:hypothetical protein
MRRGWRRCEQLGPHLDERQRRLMVGASARVLGHGGIAAMSRATGVREGTVARGAREVKSGAQQLGRVRAPGAGRKRLVETDPGLVPALLALIEPTERGDPVSPLRWTTRSTRTMIVPRHAGSNQRQSFGRAWSDRSRSGYLIVGAGASCPLR